MLVLLLGSLLLGSLLQMSGRACFTGVGGFDLGCGFACTPFEIDLGLLGLFTGSELGLLRSLAPRSCCFGLLAQGFGLCRGLCGCGFLQCGQRSGAAASCALCGGLGLGQGLRFGPHALLP